MSNKPRHICKRIGDRRNITDFWTLKNKEVRLDSCMALQVVRLAEAYPTLACCCGHNKYSKTIVIATPQGDFIEYFTGIPIPREKRFYIKDSEGFYFIPEVENVGK